MNIAIQNPIIFKKKLDRMTRLSEKRNKAVNNFWDKERERILSNKSTTRNWSAEQRFRILKGDKPNVNGKTMQGHHTYSVSKYPHLAGKHEVIFPATFEEHLYNWHRINFSDYRYNLCHRTICWNFNTNC